LTFSRSAAGNALESATPVAQQRCLSLSLGFRLACRSFDEAGFLQGARGAFEIIVNSFAAGDTAALQPLLSKQVYEAFMTKVQAKFEAERAQEAAKNKAEGDAFFAKNKTAPGVKTTASGLQYKVITAGTGARPGPNDTVEINYTGSFLDGQVFDASAKHGPKPASIPVANVIPGFREGLQLMQVGGHYKLFIPASLAYGAEPQPPMPPNATLIFDVTLVKTGPTPAAPSGSDGQ